MTSERRRPVEPLGGGRERQRLRRRPAWQDQHQGLQNQPEEPYGGGHDADLHNLHDVEQQGRPGMRPPARREPEPYQPYHPPYDEEAEPYQRRPVHDGGGGDNHTMGIVMFVLIFGLGNWLLYKYTGWLIIPIPRK